METPAPGSPPIRAAGNVPGAVATGPGGGCPGAGRSAVTSVRSPYVRAAYAASRRWSSSSKVIRPSPAAWRSTSAACSRSASETRS